MSTDTSVIREFIRNLLSATANAALYTINHQQVGRLIEAAFSRINSALEEFRDITVVIVESELVINGQPQEYSLFLNRFAEIMTSRGISHVRLLAGLTREEIVQLVASLSRQSDSDAVSSSSHLILGHVEVRPGAETSGGSGSGSDSRALSIADMPQKELDRFEEIYDAVRHHHKFKITGMAEIVSGFVDAFRQEGDSLLAMASLRNNDEYTFTHSTNVCLLNIAQAQSMGIEGQLLHDIGIAAMLHDIGKLYIPEEILTKNDSLTQQEFDIMKQHPVLGARHLLDTPGVPRLAVTTAYEHHLKFNLGGYPDVRPDWQPNLCSQMTMISDFFDALRTRRSYRGPLELPLIAAMMQERAGTDLHPVLTRNFLHIITRLTPTADHPAA